MFGTLSVETESNPYVHPHVLSDNLLKLNHPNVWLSLLREAKAVDSSVEPMLSAAFAELPIQRDDEEQKIAEILAVNNLNFFGRGLIVIGMASLYGREYPNVISPTDKQVSYDIDEEHRIVRLDTIYLSGWEMAEGFGDPATSPEEVVDRLQYLFSPIDNITDDTRATATFRRRKAFAHHRPNQKVITCPGRDVSGSLFSAYGELLQYPAYRSVLAQEIAMHPLE